MNSVKVWFYFEKIWSMSSLFLWSNDSIKVGLKGGESNFRCRCKCFVFHLSSFMAYKRNTFSCWLARLRNWISSVCFFSSTCRRSFSCLSIASHLVFCSFTCLTSSIFSFSKSAICPSYNLNCKRCMHNLFFGGRKRGETVTTFFSMSDFPCSACKAFLMPKATLLSYSVW